MSTFMMCLTILLFATGCSRTRGHASFIKEIRVPHNKMHLIDLLHRDDHHSVITEDFDGVTIIAS